MSLAEFLIEILLSCVCLLQLGETRNHLCVVLGQERILTVEIGGTVVHNCGNVLLLTCRVEKLLILVNLGSLLLRALLTLILRHKSISILPLINQRDH